MPRLFTRTFGDPDSTGLRLVKTAGRVAIGGFLVATGVGHFTFARKGFRAQVPESLPFDEDRVVLASGAVEIALGAALLAVPRYRRPLVGWIAAAFLTAVYPGNISQLVNHASGAGLDTDRKRGIRMPFQALMVADALWSTGAVRAR